MSQSMFQRRCLLALTRHAVYYSPTFPSLKILPRHLSTLTPSPLDSLSIPTTSHLSLPFCGTHYFSIRHLSSKQRDDKDDEEDVEEMEEGSDEEKDENDGLLASSSAPRREYSAAEEAAEIGYEVIGSLKPSDRVFKMYEPVFAVVQIGSHQFKVSNGDCIFTEKLKFCEVNDKLLLKKVLLLGSQTKTIIGRPIVPDAAVHAVVEEHALDAKVIIFKKKRRKNYRRTKGHRQELTKLRITDIQGIEKPEKTAPSKLVKAPPVKKSPKVQVPLPVVA